MGFSPWGLEAGVLIKVIKLQKTLYGCIVLLFTPLLSLPSSAASLIYSVTYPWTTATRPVALGHGIPEAQKLESVRNAQKTEIYSVSIETGKRTLLFSDAGAYFEILAPNLAAIHGDKAYVKGVERHSVTVPFPQIHADPEAIYELALDGSNHFRKLFELDAKNPAGELFLNPDGSEIATVGDNNGVSIHALSTGALLHSWNVTSMLQKHCPDCLPVSHGWLADGKRLFLTLEIGDLDGDSPAPTDLAGTYFLTEDGKDAGGLPASAGTINSAEVRRDSEDVPRLLGQSPNGDYIFWDFAFQQDSHSPPPAHAQSFVTVGGRDGKTKQVVPVRASGPWLHLSPSGRFLAYFESRATKNYQSDYHLWIKDLEAGTEKEILTGAPGSASIGQNTGLNVIGWDGRN